MNNIDVLDSYSKDIEFIINNLEDSICRDLMCNALQRIELLNLLRNAPYGLEGPMVYSGGLLVHVIHALSFCKVAIQQAKELNISINPSIILTGCILRNIGWCTITNELKPRDAYYMIGLHKASSRFINHLIMNCENDLQINISESKKQVLENMCNEPKDILSLEGRIVANADHMANIIDFGSFILNKKHKIKDNWSAEGKLFIGHLHG